MAISNSVTLLINQKINLMETIILRNVCTARSGPTNGSFGTDFFDYFSKLWGVTILHTPRNMGPRLWYTFLVCMSMSIPLRDFVPQK